MAMIKANLIVDLGNSETRCTLRVGEIKIGNRYEYTFTQSNSFTNAFDGYPKNSAEYTEDNTTIFQIEDERIGTTDIIGGTYVNGLMSDNEFQGYEGRPSAQELKYNSQFTFYSIITGIKESGRWMTNYFKEKQNQDVTLQEVINQTEWSITLLLPPSQVDKGKEVLTKSLQGSFNVKYLMPEADVTVTISEVDVYSEGEMAYMAVLIKKSDKTVRKNKQFMLTSTVLVVDIGAGTTDIVLIRNNSTVENSKHTIPYGGNNIRGRLQQKVNLDYNLNLPSSNYDEATIKGTIKKNNKTYDVTEQLSVSKREVAQLINNSIQSYLDSASLPIQTVEYILVVGGGSLTSPSPKIEPISKYILAGFKRFSPDVELLDIEDVTTETLTINGDSNEVNSVRNLNIIGAGVVSDLKELREIQQEQNADK